MKTLNNFLNEALIKKDTTLKTDDIDIISIKNLEDLHDKNNKSQLSRFLKGTTYQSDLNIYIISLHRYLHIHRYSELHQLSLTIVYDSSQLWPEADDWEKRSIVYDELDDRMPMKILFDKFYNYLTYTIKK